MKDIVVIANFCRDFSQNDNGRFMYLCKELSNENKVEIITSNFDHSSKQQKKPSESQWPFSIKFLHEPGYKKNISLKRFFSHYIWGREVESYLTHRVKPDVVYCAVPSLAASLAAAKYCEKNRIKFIIDIQDLWPEAFQMVFSLPIISNLFFFPFRKIADEIYSKADEICAVSKTYVDRALLVNKKCVSGNAVFLGTSLKKFDQFASESPIIVKKNNELWLGYCGSLSTSYDIPSVISALQILKVKGIRIPKFIVMGDGASKSEFEAFAKESAVDVIFTGNLPYSKMCAILVRCDIVINPIRKRSSASIINKHGDYASAGSPVLNTQDSQEYRNLVDEYEMGLNCKNGNVEDLADKLELLLNNADLRFRMGKNARKCAEERFDRSLTYRLLVACVEEAKIV